MSSFTNLCMVFCELTADQSIYSETQGTSQDRIFGDENQCQLLKQEKHQTSVQLNFAHLELNS